MVTITITQAIQYYVRQQSDEISRMKGEGVQRETLEKIAYVSPDGKSFIDRAHAKSAKSAGWKLAKVRYERVTGFMSPRHARWREYLEKRHRASLLLTARLILKLGGESVPAFQEVAQALRHRKLRGHARRGRERRMCIDAYRYLRKLNSRLERAPEKFASVAGWLTERESERPPARSAVAHFDELIPE